MMAVKTTSHMLPKFFNTHLINSGMAEENLGTSVWHLNIRSGIHTSYQTPDELRKSYMVYDNLNVKNSSVNISIDEICE